MNTKITAIYRLFDRVNDTTPLELEYDSLVEPTIDQAKGIIMDQLHETKDADGNLIIVDQVDEKVFTTIQFLEVLIEYRKKMICYKWRRATLKNTRTKMIECSEYGAFVMTKTIM